MAKEHGAHPGGKAPAKAESKKGCDRNQTCSEGWYGHNTGAQRAVGKLGALAMGGELGLGRGPSMEWPQPLVAPASDFAWKAAFPGG